MQITVNGKLVETTEAISGAQLLAMLSIPPETAVAELNGVHIPRSLFLSTQISEGDQVELVSLVGGG